MGQTVAEADTLELGRRLDALHQLLYTRGGIRPSNAAVEELTKVLLLCIAAQRYPNLKVGGHGTLVEVLDPSRVRVLEDLRSLKEAFGRVNALPELGGRVPDGSIQSVWPADEPLRITRGDVAAEALDILQSIALGLGSSFDVAGTAFDVFLRGRYEHAGGLGTYLTPHSVVQAMVEIGFELIDPFSGWDGRSPVMGDPCCGSGRFLIGMIEHAVGQGLAVEESLHEAVVGADQSASSVAMARVNLLAYGLPPAEVFTVDDSITDSSLDRLRGRLRLILTNPPFGDGKYDSEEGIRRAACQLPGVSTKSRTDPALAFLARCVDLLAPDGVAGVILPDGVADGAHVRDLLLGDERLLDAVRLEGVVSLPSATFAPAGTMAKTSVVFLRRARSEGARVFLARADHVGHVMKKGAVATDPDGDDLPGLSAVVRNVIAARGNADDAGARVLSIDPSLLTSLDASSIDRDAIRARHDATAAGGRELSCVLRGSKKRRAALEEGVPFVSVLHVDEFGNVDWVDAQSYRPTTPGIVAHAGQILVSLLNPSKFRATVIPDAYAVVQCSAEFGVFDSVIDPYAALALLQHPLVRAQIGPLGRGTSSSRRRIETGDVLRLVAPPYDDDWVDKTGTLVSEALAMTAEARARLRAAYSSDDS
jgi:SAM-dependent methyltransferase